MQLVDLFSGEHLGDAYSATTPAAGPLLEDGDFRLTEVRHLIISPTRSFAGHPKDLKNGAVN